MTSPWTPGDEIRRARKNAGLEQTDLAQLVGVTQKTISNWENGRSEPTISHWRKIADVTGAGWLVGAEYAVVTPRLRLLTVAPKKSHSYARMHRQERRGPWMASTHIFNGARNEDSDPSTYGSW